MLLGSLEQQLGEDRREGEQGAGELTAFATREAGIQAELKEAGQAVTDAEVAAQRARDHTAEAEAELEGILGRLGEAAPDAGPEQPPAPLDEAAVAELSARVERLERRREQLGPVNPLAQAEYAEALAHVEELEGQREDLETAMRELRALIRETDRQIEETFEQTFSAASRNFEQLVGEVFPGGTGRLRLVEDEQAPRPVLGGEPLEEGEGAAEGGEDEELEEVSLAERSLPGVEIEITPAGKSTKRLTLLSGGEKSMTALAFLFAVFLARPCPFYILDEVEAALDDLNLDRFLALLRRYCGEAQFIVITHQKRTMEAADWLFGVSMGQDGVSKVISRHLRLRERAAAGDRGGRRGRLSDRRCYGRAARAARLERSVHHRRGARSRRRAGGAAAPGASCDACGRACPAPARRSAARSRPRCSRRSTSTPGNASRRR